MISLGLERIILNELIFRYRDLSMTESSKERIRDLVNEHMSLKNYKDQ